MAAMRLQGVGDASKVIVTGAAGFIGARLCARLLDDGVQVVGVDNFNDYYDPALKKARLALIDGRDGFSFERFDLADRAASEAFFAKEGAEAVVHLAAQAGVRYSLENPHAYIESNLVAFTNILEACRRHGAKHLVYASSSSVYGANKKMPFSTEDSVDHPVSLYAATKKSNELMAHCYSHLYGFPTTGLRFFTVYGPWYRPDMALYLFATAMRAEKPIKVFNHGRMKRDFTYIDDIVEGVVRVTARPPAPGTAAETGAPYKVYNIGNNQPVELGRVIRALETSLGVEAEKIMLDMQPGDVPATYADVADLERDIGFKPATEIEDGVARFAAWFDDYHGHQR